MPDYSFISQSQVPNAMNTLGSMMNLANSAQQLKTSQQAYQGQNIDLQKAQQANDERLRLQQFMANPDNFQTNGRIDLNKANAAIPQIAPYTGGEVLQKLSTLSNAQTTALQAKQNMTQSQRAIVAGPIGVLGRAGVTDPAAYAGELENLKATNPDNPELHKLVDSYKTVLGMMQPGPHVAQVAITAVQSLMSPSEQQSQLSPTAGLTNTGGTLAETVSQPSVAGNAPSISLTGRSAPLTLAPSTQRYNPQTQQMEFIGQPAGQPAAAVPAAPPLGTEQAASGRGVTVAQDWQQTLAASQKAAQNVGVLQEIKKYAPGAVAGVAQDRRAFLTGLAGLIGMDAGQMEKTDTDLLAKNTNMLALAGGNTNLAKELSEVANPNVHMTKEAITRAANQVIAQQQLLLVRANHLGKLANNPDAYTQAATEFNLNADPRVLQYPTMTPAERVEMKKAMNPQEQIEFGNKLRFFQHFGYLK